MITEVNKQPLIVNKQPGGVNEQASDFIKVFGAFTFYKSNSIDCKMKRER